MGSASVVCDYNFVWGSMYADDVPPDIFLNRLFDFDGEVPASGRDEDADQDEGRKQPDPWLPCQPLAYQQSRFANEPNNGGMFQPAVPPVMPPIQCPPWPSQQPQPSQQLQPQQPQLQQNMFSGSPMCPTGSMEASGSILQMQLEGGMGHDDRGSPDATGTTCAAELSPRDSLGLKRKNNSLAQRRYRAWQKQKTQGLQETLQQLASKVSELEVVNKACAMLQSEAEKLRLASAVVDANIAVHRPHPDACATVNGATPNQPPSSGARHRAPAPDAGAIGGAGGASEDARADDVVQSIASKLHEGVARAHLFLSTLPASHVSMGDLPQAEAATACDLADSCAASCMQIWAASIHYDVAPQISAKLAQHTQHGDQRKDDVHPQASRRATWASQWRVCKAPEPTQVAHNDPSGQLLLSPADRLTVDAWPSSVPPPLNAPLQPPAGTAPAGAAPEWSAAPIATSAALQLQRSEHAKPAAAGAGLRRGHDPRQLLALAQSLKLSRAAKQQARLLLRAHMIRMHEIVENRLCLRLDAVKVLLPRPLGTALRSEVNSNLRKSGNESLATMRVLGALEASLLHERRAQQELVYLTSMRVLDAAQWCTVAAALHPLHCDLEPLLKAIVQLPL